MKNQTLKVAAVLLILLIIPITGCAAGEKRGSRKGPPPEAIEACEGKSLDDSVTFTGRRGESLEATCQEVEGQLVAVPEGMKPGGGKPE